MMNSTKFPLQSPAAMNAFYGNPDPNGDGLPDASFESKNIIRLIPPYPMKWSWGPSCKAIPIHMKAAPSLLQALQGIAKEFDAEQRARFQLDQCGGGYNFRLMRGANRLSIHSWGAAVDLAPLLNPLNRPYDSARGMMPLQVVKIFESVGWVWGGDWDVDGDTKDQKIFDSMHFQAARVV